MASHQQIVKNRPLSSLAGIGLIAAIVVILYCSGVIMAALQRRFGLSYASASVLVWLLGGAMAFLVLYDRILSYRYTLSGSTLSLDRLYGRYMRHARDIMFRQIEDFGPAEEMEKKYPGSKRERYVRRQCELLEMAVVHISGQKRCISVIQPDDAIRSALENRPKKR